MNSLQTVVINQPCYLLNPKRITEKVTQRNAGLVADFKTAFFDFYRDSQWETNFWEEMGGVIEHRKYMAQLNDGELALSQMYL